MARIQLERIKDQIIGIQPLYTEIGNSTRLYLQEGEVLDSRVLYSAILALGKLYAIDLSAQREFLKGVLKRQGVMPFYLSDDRVFVPLKMRKRLTKNDNVYGYVDVRYIGDVIPNGKQGSILKLKDGREISILSPRGTVDKMQRLGERILAYRQSPKALRPDEQTIINAGLYFYYTLEDIRQQIYYLKEHR